jgi:hypothetical protein
LLRQSFRNPTLRKRHGIYPGCLPSTSKQIAGSALPLFLGLQRVLEPPVLPGQVVEARSMTRAQTVAFGCRSYKVAARVVWKTGPSRYRRNRHHH